MTTDQWPMDALNTVACHYIYEYIIKISCNLL